MGPGIITDEMTELMDRGPKNMWVNKQANLQKVDLKKKKKK